VQGLIQTMCTRNQFDDYLVHVADQLCQTETRFSAILNQTMYYPYRPVDVILPSPEAWSVYMIASLKDTRVTYIGSTRNLRRRLDAHNKGKGSTMTNSPAYLPWGLISYVIGFGDLSSHHSQTLQFKRGWYQKK
jgi:predicted GIY-YIG superfamily endonuclease